MTYLSCPREVEMLQHTLTNSLTSMFETDLVVDSQCFHLSRSLGLT